MKMLRAYKNDKGTYQPIVGVVMRDTFRGMTKKMTDTIRHPFWTIKKI